MPERSGPYSLLDDFNKLDQRLRTVERHTHGLAAAAVTLSEQLATMSDWDAIVDGSLDESDPDQRVFLGIGEAEDWLYNSDVKYQTTESHAAIYVRSNDADGNLITYTETADWDAPARVLLFGGGAGSVSTSMSGIGFIWRPGNFHPTQAGVQHTLIGCGSFGIAKSSGGAATWGGLQLINSGINSSNSSGTTNTITSQFRALRCDLQNGIPNGLSSGSARFDLCDIDQNTQTSTPVTTTNATSSLEMLGCIVRGAGTINLPRRFRIDWFGAYATGGSAAMPALVLPSNSDTQGAIKIVSTSSPPAVTATSAFSRLELDGQFAAVTATGAHDHLRVEGQCIGSNLWDITGPAIVDMSFKGNVGVNQAALKLRGSGIDARARLEVNGGAPTDNRRAVHFINADNNIVTAVLDGTATTDLFRPWEFDASSSGNFLIVTGASTFPLAGLDSNGTNRIEEPPDPGYITQAENVHEVRDEGADQGDAATFDFVGPGVTATVAAGVATVTIPGGGGSDGLTVADWAGF